MSVWGLRLRRKIAYAGFKAGRKRELRYRKLQSKNIFPGIEGGKKYCLCRGLKIVPGLSEQGDKYTITPLMGILSFHEKN